jgi:hypothetical protein
MRKTVSIWLPSMQLQPISIRLPPSTFLALENSPNVTVKHMVILKRGPKA